MLTECFGPRCTIQPDEKPEIESVYPVVQPTIRIYQIVPGLGAGALTQDTAS
jgi:hypothetical protein